MHPTTTHIDGVLDAAIAVFTERTFRELTFAAIADRAGTEPGPLAEQWQHPAELLVDAVVRALPAPTMPGVEGLRAELLAVATGTANEFAQCGDVMLRIMAEMRDHPELEQAFWKRFMRPRIERGRAIFGRARLRGELRPEADPELVLSLLPALFTYRGMLGAGIPDDRFAERLVDSILVPLLARNR